MRCVILYLTPYQPGGMKTTDVQNKSVLSVLLTFKVEQSGKVVQFSQSVRLSHSNWVDLHSPILKHS